MTLFLTSHIGGSVKIDGRRVPALIMPDNRLVMELKSRWKPNTRILLIVADPMDVEKADTMKRCFDWAFPHSGLPIEGITIWDGRKRDSQFSLSDYQVIILSGGHVPTQNAFFRDINLAQLLYQYDGIIIGISAGTMNCARTVYAHPELAGEAVDPNYQRFIPGLGLTDCMILPHYQAIKDDELDGLRLFEDIAYPDSMGHCFYALPDGSYILLENGVHTLFGEGFIIHDGSLKRIGGADTLMKIDVPVSDRSILLNGDRE